MLSTPSAANAKVLSMLRHVVFHIVTVPVFAFQRIAVSHVNFDSPLPGHKPSLRGLIKRVA